MTEEENLVLHKKVGLTGLIFLILIISLTFYLIIKFSAADTYDVKVRFLFIGNLKKGAPVKFIGGLDIGYVKNIYIKNQEVEVLLAIKKDFNIREHAEISIFSIGMLGDKFINITQNSSSGKFIKPGTTLIGNSALGLEVVQQNLAKFSDTLTANKTNQQYKKLDILLNELSKKLRRFNYLIYNFRPNLKQTLRKGKAKTEMFNSKINQIKKAKVIITNLKELSKAELSINNFYAYISELNSNLDQINNELENLLHSDILTSINDIKNNKKNLYHQLIYNEKLYDIIEETIENLADFSEEIADNPYKIFSQE